MVWFCLIASCAELSSSIPILRRNDGFIKHGVQAMKSIPKLAVAATMMLIGGQLSLAQATADDAQPALPVSIVKLLAQPASNNAKRVQVSGFLVLDFEGQALYLHREDYQEGLTRNAVRVALLPEQLKQYEDFAGSYVSIGASFIKRRNSEDIFTGSLFDVKEIRKTLSRH
jgi:hypothetical protein